MNKMFKNFCLCLLVLIGLSCTSNKRLQPNYRVEPFMNSPRIFYGETGNPIKSEYQVGTCERLSQEELKKIQALVAERTQKSIWFVRVPLSSSQRYRGQLWVYLAPDVANARYRSGLAYTIGMLSSSKGLYVSEPWRYIQVSLPDKVFDSVLETPGISELPFQYPSQNRQGEQDIFSEKELVELLDYVRNPKVYIDLESMKINPVLATTYIRGKIAETVISQPLVSINKVADEVRVTFGFVHNGLYAHCTEVTFKIIEQGYELIKWGLSVA
ncbi:MAG: hypothetical protein JW715_11220 [Sedimentisphaerales bacterium]|nr:hypothetical protein [Sedimentisphaerales bacterium]